VAPGQTISQGCDLEGGLGSVEQAEELVAAELAVPAEDEQRVAEVSRRADVRLRRYMRPRPDGEHGLRIERAGELVVWPMPQDVGGDRRSDEPHQDDEDDVNAADDRELVARETVEDVLQYPRARTEAGLPNSSEDSAAVELGAVAATGSPDFQPIDVQRAEDSFERQPSSRARGADIGLAATE
jgi:hypothetical protein